MAAVEQMEIKLSAQEAAGLATWINFIWGRHTEALGDSIDTDTRGLMTEMGILLDLHDDLSEFSQAGEDGSVTAPRHLLRDLIREGAEYGRETASHVFAGDYGQEAEQDRLNEAKGLMLLARREGLYEGVMV